MVLLVGPSGAQATGVLASIPRGRVVQQVLDPWWIEIPCPPFMPEHVRVNTFAPYMHPTPILACHRACILCFPACILDLQYKNVAPMSCIFPSRLLQRTIDRVAIASDHIASHGITSKRAVS